MDYRCQTQVVITELTEAEIEWLEAAFKAIAESEETFYGHDADGQVIKEDGSPAVEPGSMGELLFGKDGISDLHDEDYVNWDLKLGIDVGTGYIYSDSGGPNLDGLISFLKLFLKLHRPKGVLSFTWGWQEGGDGGGGASIVTAEKAYTMNTESWVEDQMKKVRKVLKTKGS